MKMGGVVNMPRKPRQLVQPTSGWVRAGQEHDVVTGRRRRGRLESIQALELDDTVAADDHHADVVAFSGRLFFHSLVQHLKTGDDDQSVTKLESHTTPRRRGRERRRQAEGSET